MLEFTLLLMLMIAVPFITYTLTSLAATHLLVPAIQKFSRREQSMHISINSESEDLPDQVTVMLDMMEFKRNLMFMLSTGQPIPDEWWDSLTNSPQRSVEGDSSPEQP